MSTNVKLSKTLKNCLVLLSFTVLFVDCQRGYYEEIKDAMYSLKNYLHTGLDSLSKLAKTIETVEQFVDATIDEDCEPFICPKGIEFFYFLFPFFKTRLFTSIGYTRQTNPQHTPESNGCGSFGYQVD